MISKPIILLCAALTTGSLILTYAHSVWPTTSVANITMLPSCREVDPLATRLTDWVRHTVADTGLFAADNRADARLRSGRKNIRLSVVTDVSLCAVLQARYARAVAGRDTLNPDPILALAVGSTHYVVTDALVSGADPPPPSNRVMLDGNRGHMDMVTLTVALDRVRVWRWNPTPGMPLPY